MGDGIPALARQFFARGWCAFPHDPALAAWAETARPLAEATLDHPDLRTRWLRCGGTWFAGVHALPNDAAGAVPGHGVPPLAGAALEFIGAALGLAGIALDRAQVSICFPGYPQPWEGESEAALRYRRERDAAHVDGLTRVEPGRRRRLGETHAFILGIALTETRPEAAPFTVYEGSHAIMRRAFRARLAPIDPARWGEEDITEAYHAARREAFATCKRVTLHARPGEAYIAHRLVLHGVAPWGDPAETRPRAIAYFRPGLPQGDGPAGWLERP
ncbi:MAG TPA: hypothetical protein VMM59_12650 [Thermohalobaculum sp.]|nr:hypothetical protein [Thermohalobaculum sp.]